MASGNAKDGLACYTFHGMDLEPQQSGEHMGDCPLCLKEGKWSVNPNTGLWQCFSCLEQGNHYLFLRRLWELSDTVTNDDWLAALAEDRGLLPQTLRAWGVVRSTLTNEALVPGYNAEGALCNLYRYALERKSGRLRLYATPGCNHQLHAPLVFNDGLLRPKTRIVYLAEGPWDGMAVWETLGHCMRRTDGSIQATASAKNSMRRFCDVLAVPGAGVWNPTWGTLLAGKGAVFLYDNDHPRKHPQNGTLITGTGWAGTKKAVQSVLSLPPEGQPEEIQVLCWGGGTGEYHDDGLPSGYDVRDALLSGGSTDDSHDWEARARQLDSLHKTRIGPYPADWVSADKGGKTLVQKLKEEVLLPLPCERWEDLEAAWEEALEWSGGLSRTLSAMLACVTSTGMPEDQLWLKVMGPPSCGKSTLCEALSTARGHVFPKSNIRGFHSGYKTDKDGAEDHGLIGQINGKTMVTKDGDTLLSTINLSSILSQARDLYDGSSRAHYLNGIDRNAENIRFTWILCGTPSLRALDTSELGERFIDIRVVDTIDEETERKIQHKKLESLFGESLSGHKPPTQHADGGMHGGALAHAMRLTGGYVNYLRENAQRLIGAVQVSRQAATQLIDLAQFVSFMRARPSIRQDEVVERELSARLTGQLGQLARATAAVLGRKSLDDEVMRRVKQAGMDTSQGRTLQIVQLLRKSATGLEDKTLLHFTDLKIDKLHTLLQFLRKIGAVQPQTRNVTSGLKSRPRWMLTPRLVDLFDRVVGKAAPNQKVER